MACVLFVGCPVGCFCSCGLVDAVKFAIYTMTKNAVLLPFRLYGAAFFISLEIIDVLKKLEKDSQK